MEVPPGRQTEYRTDFQEELFPHTVSNENHQPDEDRLLEAQEQIALLRVWEAGAHFDI